MTVYFCDTDLGTGDDDGSTWAHAFQDLQDAIDTITGSASHDLLVRDRTITLTAQIDFDKSLNIYGGCDGTEAAEGDRPGGARTTLDGDDTVRCMEVSGTSLSDELDGFVFTQGGDGTGAEGAGLHITSSVTASNFEITYCDSNGSAMAVNGGAPAIFEARIHHNIGAYSGGALCIGESSSGTLFVNVLAHDNEAQYGGGVYSNGGASASYGRFVNCTFVENNALYTGGGFRNYNNSSGAIDIENCILWDNTTGGSTPSEIADASATVSVDYSDVEGSYSGTGNVNTNPNFLGSGDDPYDLTSSTPSSVYDGANTGATNYPSTDILGRSRSDGAMGSYEYDSGGGAVEGIADGETTSSAIVTAAMLFAGVADALTESNATATAEVLRTEAADGKSTSSAEATAVVLRTDIADGKTTSNAVTTAAVLHAADVDALSDSNATADGVVLYAADVDALSDSSAEATAEVLRTEAADGKSTSSSITAAEVLRTDTGESKSVSNATATAEVLLAAIADSLTDSAGVVSGTVLGANVLADGRTTSNAEVTASILRAAAATSSTTSSGITSAAMLIVGQALGKSMSSGTSIGVVAGESEVDFLSLFWGSIMKQINYDADDNIVRLEFPPEWKAADISGLTIAIHDRSAVEMLAATAATLYTATSIDMASGVNAYTSEMTLDSGAGDLVAGDPLLITGIAGTELARVQGYDSTNKVVTLEHPLEYDHDDDDAVYRRSATYELDTTDTDAFTAGLVMVLTWKPAGTGGATKELAQIAKAAVYVDELALRFSRLYPRAYSAITDPVNRFADVAAEAQRQVQGELLAADLDMNRVVDQGVLVPAIMSKMALMWSLNGDDAMEYEHGVLSLEYDKQIGFLKNQPIWQDLDQDSIEDDDEVSDHAPTFGRAW